MRVHLSAGESWFEQPSYFILRGNVPASSVITIYGANDPVLDKTKIKDSEIVVIIEGGNHTYFGNYGEQAGDGRAAIFRERQQEIAAAAILGFIKGQNERLLK